MYFDIFRDSDGVECIFVAAHYLAPLAKGAHLLQYKKWVSAHVCISKVKYDEYRAINNDIDRLIVVEDVQNLIRQVCSRGMFRDGAFITPGAILSVRPLKFADLTPAVSSMLTVIAEVNF